MIRVIGYGIPLLIILLGVMLFLEGENPTSFISSDWFYYILILLPSLYVVIATILCIITRHLPFHRALFFFSASIALGFIAIWMHDSMDDGSLAYDADDYEFLFGIILIQCAYGYRAFSQHMNPSLLDEYFVSMQQAKRSEKENIGLGNSLIQALAYYFPLPLLPLMILYHCTVYFEFDALSKQVIFTISILIGCIYLAFGVWINQKLKGNGFFKYILMLLLAMGISAALSWLLFVKLNSMETTFLLVCIQILFGNDMIYKQLYPGRCFIDWEQLDRN